MPIYEYECQSCLGKFERTSKIKDRRKNLECPLCSSKEVELVLHATTNILKGSGWYRDGYTKEKK